jgi:glycosyltransferase involved in cell wall biosynthesis
MTATEATEPVVDIGIPTRGRSKYLRETVEGVLAQTLTSWRLTISKNGSGGGDVRAALDPYLDDPRVRLTATGREVRPSENATRSIRDGRAPYVALLHDDDRWDADFLVRRVRFLQANPTCGFVFSDAYFIDDQGAVLSRFTVDRPVGLQPRREFLKALYRRNFVVVATVLASRSALEADGPAFSNSVAFYDYAMWLRIAARFDVGYVGGCDAAYRIHSDQSTHDQILRMGEHRLRLLEEVDSFLPVDFPRIERRRARSGAYARAAFDAFARGERARAVAYLGHALREHPAAPLDPVLATQVIRSLRHRARQRDAWR